MISYLCGMKILMVCLGNICRSPMAEGWMRKKVEDRNLQFTIDSAGTANYHVGEQPDKRMIQYAQKYGVDLRSLRARQFTVNDFDDFDHIYIMDASNLSNVLKLARNDNDRKKVVYLLDALLPNTQTPVPDPYYGGEKEFIEVIELLDKGTEAILNKLIQQV